MNKKITTAIPTNLISGFLGVGKTTAILHLLKTKPATERWAVLVNEFGEVGIDGSLFKGQHTETGGVFVREVPGGCMCCAAGLPMQIALNQLLARAQPNRVLIEPTGLGHPEEILAVLHAEHYREILDIQPCLTLVDARKLADPRYTENAIFNQQIDIADIIVGNKCDLYGADEKQNLANYLEKRGRTRSALVFVEHGKIDPELLTGSLRAEKKLIALRDYHHEHKHRAEFDKRLLPDCGYIKIENSGEGYHSVGWRFSLRYKFKRRALYNWLLGLHVERMKAVFYTDEGIFGYNLTWDALTEMEVDECSESRMEIITPQTPALPDFSFLDYCI